MAGRKAGAGRRRKPGVPARPKGAGNSRRDRWFLPLKTTPSAADKPAMIARPFSLGGAGGVAAPARLDPTGVPVARFPG